MDQHIINKTPSFSNPLLKKQLIKHFFQRQKVGNSASRNLTECLQWSAKLNILEWELVMG